MTVYSHKYVRNSVCFHTANLTCHQTATGAIAPSTAGFVLDFVSDIIIAYRVQDSVKILFQSEDEDILPDKVTGKPKLESLTDRTTQLE